MKSARVVFRVARGVEVRVSQGICRLFGSCPLRRTALLSTFNSLVCSGFSHVWPIALEFCSAHAGSVRGACGACISRRAAQIESFFESPNHWGFACHGLATIHARGGGRIRTI